MAPVDTTFPVRLGFMPESHAIADDDHPGLRRAGPRAGAPYGGETVEFHQCPATDLAQDTTIRPTLVDLGFDTADLGGFGELQAAFARVCEAGRIDDDDAGLIRSTLDGATLPCASGAALEVLHIADEGFIMRQAGPNGLSVVGPRTKGRNGHGVATSIHADQDVYGTPLTQLMDGKAPSLFRHHSPDGDNDDAGLMLVNVWIPLQQITQPLVLADGRSIDRRRHQLRYGLATDSFLERGDEMAINDIWTFLHDPDQRWFLRSEMDHRQAYVFDTLSTPHGSCSLPGEELAATWYQALADGEAAAATGDPAALVEAIAPVQVTDLPLDAPPPLRSALAAMAGVADEARQDPVAACADGGGAWSAAASATRRPLIRRSLELRMVVSIVEGPAPA